jgi:Raf kinase inhibitor-like YbhB/YbcL family protein
MAFFRFHSAARAERRLFFELAICAVVAVAFAAPAVVMQPPDPAKQLQLTSTAFKNKDPIPSQYTCDGKNVSPPLAWSSAPAGTQSFALIVEDPNAPTGIWTHWILFDLSSDTTELPEDAAPTGNAQQGMNDFKNKGYGGPCPPGGKPHRYIFKLFALDKMLGLKAGASKKEVEAAMTNHILAQGMLMGTYERK